MALNVVNDFILKPFSGEAMLWPYFEEDIKADIHASTLIGTKGKQFLFNNYNLNEDTNEFFLPPEYSEEEVLKGFEGLEVIIIDNEEIEVTPEMVKMRRDHIKVQEVANKVVSDMKSTLYGLIRKKISSYLKKILDVGCNHNILAFWK
jgi:hypothetical protein